MLQKTERMRVLIDAMNEKLDSAKQALGTSSLRSELNKTTRALPDYLLSSRTTFFDSSPAAAGGDAVHVFSLKQEKQMPSKIVRITWNDGSSVDNDLPWTGGPSNELPSGGYPSHGLPGMPPHAIQLPVFPFDPSLPNNDLPERPVVWPPRPGGRFIAKWLACVGLILVPDNSLPGTDAEPK